MDIVIQGKEWIILKLFQIKPVTLLCLSPQHAHLSVINLEFGRNKTAPRNVNEVVLPVLGSNKDWLFLLPRADKTIIEPHKVITGGLT